MTTLANYYSVSFGKMITLTTLLDANLNALDYFLVWDTSSTEPKKISADALLFNDPDSMSITTITAKTTSGLRLQEKTNSLGLEVADTTGDVAFDGNVSAVDFTSSGFCSIDGDITGLSNCEITGTVTADTLYGSTIVSGATGNIVGALGVGGNTTVKGNVITNEVIARTNAGLKLYEDGGKGILVTDSSGLVDISHNVNVNGTFHSDGNMTTSGTCSSDGFLAHTTAGTYLKEKGGKGISIANSSGNISISSGSTFKTGSSVISLSISTADRGASGASGVVGTLIIAANGISFQNTTTHRKLINWLN